MSRASPFLFCSLLLAHSRVEGGEDLKERAYGQTVERKKIAAITALTVISIAIIVLGTAICVSSLVHNIAFSVLNTNIHGAVFGLVIVFLGVRYFMSVQTLKKEVYKTASKFSWSNFKRK